MSDLSFYRPYVRTSPSLHLTHLDKLHSFRIHSFQNHREASLLPILRKRRPSSLSEQTYHLAGLESAAACRASTSLARALRPALPPAHNHGSALSHMGLYSKSKFISDFKHCLLSLRKHISALLAQQPFKTRKRPA